jgi:hypothetical protein
MEFEPGSVDSKVTSRPQPWWAQLMSKAWAALPSSLHEFTNCSWWYGRGKAEKEGLLLLATVYLLFSTGCSQDPLTMVKKEHVPSCALLLQVIWCTDIQHLFPIGVQLPPNQLLSFILWKFAYNMNKIKLMRKDWHLLRD